MMTRMATTHRRFTLVELLVVIAIIGVLAGFLMPAITRALRDGKKVSCLNNLRQIGFFVNQYMSDMYYGKAPQATDTAGTDEATLRADMYVIYSAGLASDEKLFVCPLQSTASSSDEQDFGDENGLSFGLTEALGKTSESNRIILADEKGAGDFSNNHGGDDTVGEDQNCVYSDTHVKRQKLSNPDDDSDDNSIYSGTASATDTVIYGP